MRTTGIQVSGYGFLLRRLELALVIGDARMAHDPLRSQRRAIFVGVLVSLLIAGGAVMLGLLRPQPSIGDADLVADETGTLHVRLEDTFHPITNVASARLVLRQPAEVQQSTAEQLAEFPHGDPMGIAVVPGLVEAPQSSFLYCEPGVIVAAPETREHPQVMLVAPSGTWMVLGNKRYLIDATAPRALGAPSLNVSDDLVGLLERQPDVRMPQGKTGLPAPFDVAGRVLLTGDRAFMSAPGGVAELRRPQRQLAEALSPHVPIHVSLAEAVAQPGVEVLPGVPREPAEWGAPETLCVGDTGIEEPRGMALPGLVGSAYVPGTPAYDGPHYIGPRGTAALVTERGFGLVSESGLRFDVGSEAELRALGFGNPAHAPWRVLSLLPDAGLLSEANARTTNATISTTHTRTATEAGTT